MRNKTKQNKNKNLSLTFKNNTKVSVQIHLAGLACGKMAKKEKLILKPTSPGCPLGACPHPPPHTCSGISLSPTRLPLFWPKKTRTGKRLLDSTKRKWWASWECAVSPLDLRSRWWALWSMQCHLHRKSTVQLVSIQVPPACPLKSWNVARLKSNQICYWHCFILNSTED